MNLSDYKKNIKKALRPRTVTLLMKDDMVMLGMKKKGFGKGYWLGIGGKVEEGETIEQAAKREVMEETSITLSSIVKAGILNFYFPHIADESWNQQVHVFIAHQWEGEPQESEEIKPEWFAKKDIPLNAMWDDAQYWLPAILKGETVTGEFMFDDTLKVTDYAVT